MFNVRGWAKKAGGLNSSAQQAPTTTSTTTKRQKANYFQQQPTSTVPLVLSNHLSTIVQARVFNRTQEDVVCTIYVVPPPSSASSSSSSRKMGSRGAGENDGFTVNKGGEANDLAAPLKNASRGSGKSSSSQQHTPFLLSLTVTRTKSGYKDPKIHEIKSKLNGDLMLKSTKSLKSFERVIAPQQRREIIQFGTLDSKRQEWWILQQQMLTHKIQTSYTHNNAIREEFVWWILTSNSIFNNRTDINTNLDTSSINNIFGRFTRALLGGSSATSGNGSGNNNNNEDSFVSDYAGVNENSISHSNTGSSNGPSSQDHLTPSSFTSVQRWIINTFIEKKRTHAEGTGGGNNNDPDNLPGGSNTLGDDINTIVLPDMTADEAANLLFFMEQGDLSISYIGELEKYLQNRLIALQQTTIENIFQSQLSQNSLLLSSLLDQVLVQLDELLTWMQTYDTTVSIMAAGISKIEKQSERLDVEDNNYVNLILVLLWLLTEITLPQKTLECLKNRKFDEETKIHEFVRACLRLDHLLTSTRLTIDNSVQNQLAKDGSANGDNNGNGNDVNGKKNKYRLMAPLASFHHHMNKLLLGSGQDDGKRLLESTPKDDLDLVLSGKKTITVSNNNNKDANNNNNMKSPNQQIKPVTTPGVKSNTTTGQLEKGKFERKTPGGGGVGLQNKTTNNTLIQSTSNPLNFQHQQQASTIVTTTGQESSVAAALRIAGIHLKLSDEQTNLSFQNSELRMVMEHRTECYRQGLIDFTQFNNLQAVLQTKKEFSLLSKSLSNAMNTLMYTIIDKCCIKYHQDNWSYTELDAWKVKNSKDVNEIMYIKMAYKLNIEKYEKLHAEISHYKPLIGICERLSPGYLPKLRQYYCTKVGILYKHDINLFFDKLRRVVHSSNIDCRLRSSPAVNLKDLQKMTDIYRNAAIDGKKATSTETELLLDMKAKIFHTEQISKVQPPPSGKLYASDVYQYALNRIQEILYNEQLFLLNTFIIWEYTDIAMMYRTMIENPLIELGKVYLLYPDPYNPSWVDLLKKDRNNSSNEIYEDREREMLSLFQGVPLKVPTAERHEDNPRSLPPRNLTTTQQKNLQISMSTLFSPITQHLLDMINIADKLDHFSMIKMLVYSERAITHATPRIMWKEQVKTLKQQQKDLREQEKLKVQQLIQQQQQQLQHLGSPTGGNSILGESPSMSYLGHNNNNNNNNNNSIIRELNNGNDNNNKRQQLELGLFHNVDTNKLKKQQQQGNNINNTNNGGSGAGLTNHKITNASSNNNNSSGGSNNISLKKKDFFTNLNMQGLLVNIDDSDDSDNDSDQLGGGDSGDETDAWGGDNTDSEMDYYDNVGDFQAATPTSKKNRLQQFFTTYTNLRVDGSTTSSGSNSNSSNGKLKSSKSTVSKLNQQYTIEEILNSLELDDYWFDKPRVSNYLGIEYFITILTQCMSSLKLKWNAFVDKEVQWIYEFKINPKQQGVLEPFAKLPAFIERLEAVCYPIHSFEADQAYTKLSVALLKWLLPIAHTNTKYENTIIYENAHYYCTSIGTRRPYLYSLESSLYHSKWLFTQARMAYVQWMVQYEMTIFITFCTKLFTECKLHLATNTLTQVSLLSGLSKDILRKLFKDHLNIKELTLHANNIYKRLQRQLPYNQLLQQETFLYIRQYLLNVIDQFLKAVELCYPHEHVPLTLEHIHQTFESVISMETLQYNVESVYQTNSILMGRQGVGGLELAGQGMLLTQDLKYNDNDNKKNNKKGKNKKEMVDVVTNHFDEDFTKLLPEREIKIKRAEQIQRVDVNRMLGNIHGNQKDNNKEAQEQIYFSTKTISQRPPSPQKPLVQRNNNTKSTTTTTTTTTTRTTTRKAQFELPPELSSSSSEEETTETETEEESSDTTPEPTPPPSPSSSSSSTSIYEEEESEEIFEFVMEEEELKDLHVDVAGREIYSEQVTRVAKEEKASRKWSERG